LKKLFLKNFCLPNKTNRILFRCYAIIMALRWLPNNIQHSSLTSIPKAIIRNIIFAFLSEDDAFSIKGTCLLFSTAYFEQDYKYPNFSRVHLLLRKECIYTKLQKFIISLRNGCWEFHLRRGACLQEIDLPLNESYWEIGLSRMSNLPALEDLTIKCGTIGHIDNLPTNLVKLTLNCYNLRDLSFLNRSSRLQELYLKNVPNVKLETIPSSLVCLKTLSVDDFGGAITSLAFLHALRSIENILFFHRNVELATLPKNMTNILKLKFDGGSISNISALKRLPNMKELTICWIPTFELNRIPISLLQKLTISSDDLNSLSSLERCLVLEELDLHSSNKINLNTIPSNLKNLRKLTLDCNELIDLPALSRCPAIEELIIAASNIKLEMLPNNLLQLRKLSLRWCDLKDVFTLGRLPNLEECDLACNETLIICSIPNILIRLRRLNLRYCNLSDISSLCYLPALEELDLSENYDLKSNTIPNYLKDIRKILIGGLTKRFPGFKNIKRRPLYE